MSKKIVVRLPVEQWTALYECAVAELEGLDDYHGDYGKNLADAAETLKTARIAAKLAAPMREP